ncbi:MAG: tRNA lysidine(34) synthetase TilS [Eubacterium sp.]
MEKQVLQYINDNGLLIAGDRILIGVSGGADSLALLYFLDRYKNDFGIRVAAAHLHHSLRGQAADDDLDFVRRYCSDNKICFFDKVVDVKALADEKKMTLEEGGRLARQTFFKEVQSCKGYNKLALGHHLNDQAETVLMRLIRGTGVKGAAGIRPISHDALKIIRPFLCVSKSEIIDYCNEKKLCFRTDSTNFEADVTRNKLRLQIMPVLKEMNPLVEEHFFSFGQIAGEYEDFLDAYVKQIMGDVFALKDDLVHFDLQRWRGESTLVKKELLRRSIFEIKGSLKEIEYNHILCIQRLIESDKTSWEYHLPHGLKAVKRYDAFWIEDGSRCKKNAIPFSYEIIPGKTYYLCREQIVLKTRVVSVDKIKNLKELKNHSEKFFDYGRIRGKLFLRSRQIGDYIAPIGINGTKKIKNYFIDRKIDREERDRIPLLALDQEVLWIIGYAVNRNYRMDESTKKVLVIEYKKL